MDVLENPSKKPFNVDDFFTQEEQDIVKETFGIFDEVKKEFSCADTILTNKT